MQKVMDTLVQLKKVWDIRKYQLEEKVTRNLKRFKSDLVAKTKKLKKNVVRFVQVLNLRNKL